MKTKKSVKGTCNKRIEALENKLSKIRIKKTYEYPDLEPGRTYVGFVWICSCGKFHKNVDEGCEHIEISFD